MMFSKVLAQLYARYCYTRKPMRTAEFLGACIIYKTIRMLNFVLVESNLLFKLLDFLLRIFFRNKRRRFSFLNNCKLSLRRNN